MHALTVVPHRAGSLRVTDVPEPEPQPGELLVEALSVGVCGTDLEIAAGDYGAAPEGRERLVIGHESLGRVRWAPADSGFAPGDLVVGVVRRPDPVPCVACAHGQFDMCRNGRYTERGIKDVDGYASRLWTVPADYAVRLDSALEKTGVLVEPTSVVAKAWQQIDAVGGRAWFEPRRALITGAGSIGLLAALLARQRGLDVHVLDRVETGVKPELVRRIGGTYHHQDVTAVMEAIRPDVVLEATGAPPVVLGAMRTLGAYGVLCLTGVSAGGRSHEVDMGELNRRICLDNQVIVGSVNANLDHYAAAAAALAQADPRVLGALITRRVPLDRFEEAFRFQQDDVKVVLELD